MVVFTILLFFMSLVIISWPVLRYLSERNGCRKLPPRLDLAMEKALIDILASQTSHYDDFWTYIHFLYIFTCINVLVKSIEMVENIRELCVCLRSMLNRILRAKGSAEKRSSGREHYVQGSEQNLDLVLSMHQASFINKNYRKMNKNLRVEIFKMWKRNEYLHQHVRELEQHNLLLIGKGLFQASDEGVVFQENGIEWIKMKGGCDGKTLVRSCGDIGSDFGANFCIHEGGNCGIDISLGCVKIVCAHFCDAFQGNAAGADGEKVKKHSELLNGQLVRVINNRGWRFPFQRNIFIANQFLYMNRKVYVNDGSINQRFQSCNGGNFSQVWQKYLKIQHINYDMSSGLHHLTPKVVTTAKIETVQGEIRYSFYHFVDKYVSSVCLRI